MVLCRDGSACLSYHIDKSGKKWPIPHRRIEWTEEEYFVRNRQVRERSHEACQTLDLAYALNNAQIPNLNMFKDSLDLNAGPVMCGHSFGGATTLMALAADNRFQVGIVLDGWLFPIRDETELNAKVKQKPILFVNTESFLNEDNLKKMETFKSDEIERICHYIKGSVHQNHIDAPAVLRGAKLRKMLGMHSDTCPNLVMTLNNKLMVSFIRKHLQQECEKEVLDFVQQNADLLKEGFGTDHCIVKPPGQP